MKRIKIPILIIILLAILILPFQKIYGEEKKLNSLSIHVDDTTGEALFGVQFSIFQVDTSNDYYPSSTHDAKKHLIDSSKQSLITDSNGDVSFTDLNDGIYYVVENLGDIETAGFPNNPFLIELPHEDGDGNVKIQLKSQELYIDQFVNNADYADYDYAAINKAKHKPVFTDEKFGYTILSYFPEDIDASVGGHYVITDKIDKSITAYPDTLRVYVVP
ncbi:MAG: hypothetical protein LBM02_02120, partial [Lachnospiraceae bacterium]|nr:hypothetical protein [Lachnospiraceae bacterium]